MDPDEGSGWSSSDIDEVEEKPVLVQNNLKEAIPSEEDPALDEKG